MSVVARNHTQPFRPLRGGIAIMNGNNGPSGTLGFVATSDGTDRWIVSAHHVMRGQGLQVVDNDPIFQPALGGSAQPIAFTKAARADETLDVAAALVEQNVIAIGEILGIGMLGAVIEPAVGMRVVKSGVATGITEGVITGINGDDVLIEMPAGYPSKYELSAVSDSGSLWLEEATASPVAVHVAGNDTGVEVALGVRVSRVLQALGLAMF
jgi:hypothetical protein